MMVVRSPVQVEVRSSDLGGRCVSCRGSRAVDVQNPARGQGLEVHGRDAFEFQADKKVTISRWF